MGLNLDIRNDFSSSEIFGFPIVLLFKANSCMRTVSLGQNPLFTNSKYLHENFVNDRSLQVDIYVQ